MRAITTFCLGLASLAFGLVGTAMTVGRTPDDPLGGDRLIEVNPIQQNENSEATPNGLDKDDDVISKSVLEKDDDFIGVGTL